MAKKVLIIDDEKDMRVYLEALFRKEGFETETAENGDDGLWLAEANRPDLITLDILMPKKSGIKFLYEMKHHTLWAKIPVIIVTAHAHDDLGREDLRDALSGKGLVAPGGYLEKPVQPEAYVRMVCSSMGIPYTPVEGASATLEKLRGEVEGLLEGADSEQLAEMLNLLKSKTAG